MIGDLNRFTLPPGFEAQELFDVFGSDALTHDLNDPEHQWIPIDQVATEHLRQDYIDITSEEAYHAELRTQLLGEDDEDPASLPAVVHERPITGAERELLRSVLAPGDSESGTQTAFGPRSTISAFRRFTEKPIETRRENEEFVRERLIRDIRAGTAKLATVHPGTLHLPRAA